MRWRKSLRFLSAVQLLPILESGEETLVGGQAVLEGVMMRSPHAWGIAVRRPTGEMVTHAEPLERPSERRKWTGWPVVRGVVTLGQAMTLGFRALRFSANVALEDLASAPKHPNMPTSGLSAALPGVSGAPSGQAGQEKKLQISGWVAAVNILISVGFFIFMYKFIPLLAATEMKRLNPAFGGQIPFNLVDGAVRLVLFLLFIWAVSLWRDIRRVYEYHGAEHKTVFAFESAEPVSVAAAQKFSTYHPRCGTSFLMTVMLISIMFYTLVPATTFWARFGARIALLPLIAGISYEIIRFAARLRARSQSGLASALFKALTQPGLWLQRITTQPPADDQVECAIVALDRAMELEKQRGGELVLA